MDTFSSINTLPSGAPKLVFIVPYRDREQQYKFFSYHMKNVLSNYAENEYAILYIHQKDTRPFNRGAIKNIGFLVVKDMYPDNYRHITLVFNDIDTMQFSSGFLPYCTVAGVVKHFYGFNYALGGIVSINAGDFESINGFPNYWAWGYEDNELNDRVNRTGSLKLDRSVFYSLLDKNILHLQCDLHRVMNRNEYNKYIKKVKDDLTDISNLQYSVNKRTGMIDVTNFSTKLPHVKESDVVHDLRKGNKPFKRKPKMDMMM